MSRRYPTAFQCPQCLVRSLVTAIHDSHDGGDAMVRAVAFAEAGILERRLEARNPNGARKLLWPLPPPTPIPGPGKVSPE
jgi:hypothetical protein